MRGIYWLASYPKSGNTWLRVFLNNYLQDTAEPVSINALGYGNTAYERVLLDDWLGAETADMSCETIDLYRPRYYEAMSELPRFRFTKTHEQFHNNSQDEPIFSPGATAGVVLLIRNPLDIAVSLSRFLRISMDAAIDQMANESLTLSPRDESLYGSLPQFVGDWSTHAVSWLESGLPIHVTRYEDLIADPKLHFGNIVNFLGLPQSSKRLKSAVSFSRIEELQDQEKRAGFRELHTGTSVFFREGSTGGWRKILDKEQGSRVCRCHSELMRRFGYQDS